MAQSVENKRNIGSAAILVGDQKILFIFVDDDGAGPWTDDLRKVVEDKIQRSLRWLEDKARLSGIQLRLHHACAPVKSTACHAMGRIDETDLCAGPGHSTWQNHVVSGLTRKSSSVASCWYELFETSGLPLNSSEGSAVFFCVRRYCPSIAFPFFEGENIEFERERGIIYDNGGETGQLYLDSLIAHEILHLYGAVDLAPEKAPVALMKYVKPPSNDVMHTSTQHPIDNYCLGDLSRYLIGWSQKKPAWLPQTTI